MRHELSVKLDVSYARLFFPFVTNYESPVQMELDLQTSCSMRNTYALKQTVRQSTGRKGKQGRAASAPSPWTVVMECSLAADTKRIFDALTVPEYIEAWICVPGTHPDCRNVSCRDAQGFQIEHQCNTGPTTRITGTYFSFLKRKLSFSWQPATEAGSGESFVDIRLYGDFERSILRLRHCGFRSEEEFQWHLALWTTSIARLSKLFVTSSNGADQIGPHARMDYGGGRDFQRFVRGLGSSN